MRTNKWIELSGAGIQMGVTIYLFAWLGKWLDQEYQTEKPYFAVGLSVLAVFISLYLLLQTLKRINKRDE